MPPRSKRQRKQKDLVSLRSKKSSLSHDGDFDTVDDSNAYILPSSDHKQQPDAEMDDSTSLPQPSLSKSQQRKLKKIQQEKDRREQRAQVFASLAQHQLDTQALALLRPASARGKTDSKKESLRRMLQLERMGVTAPSTTDSGALLLKQRKIPSPPRPSSPNHDMSNDASSEEEEDEDSLVGAEEMHQFIHVKQGLTHHTVADETNTSNDHNGYGGSTHHKRKKNPRLVDSVQFMAAEEPQDHHHNAAAALLRHAIDQARAEISQDAGLQRPPKSLHDRDNDLIATQKRRPSVPLQSIHNPDVAMTTTTAVTATTARQQHRVVLVNRSEDIQAVRLHLPITGMEQEIMEALSENDVILLCGETGCGKTTQVPQFLYEAGYGCSLFPERRGMIGVTQPRKVAAVSTATRVAEELSSSIGDLVGYQVRYDRHVGSSTALKFMTDGILLREIQEDFLLRKYSALVVDEAHERSLNTDILLGMLSRIVGLRRKMSGTAATASTTTDTAANDGNAQNHDAASKCITPDSSTIAPLKLIIMSATLRIEDFIKNKKLFTHPPPVVTVPARQYPVTVHFSKKTELHDYVNAAFKKTCQIHKKLPPGGILVFVTGQREVEYLCKKLRKTFAHAEKHHHHVTFVDNDDSDDDDSDDDDDDDDMTQNDVDGAEAAYTLDNHINDDDSKMMMHVSPTDAHDDYYYNSDDDGDDDGDVVVLGGEGFTPEQIAEAELNFEGRFCRTASTAPSSQPTTITTATTDNNNKENIRTKEDTLSSPSQVHVLPLYAMLPPREQSKCFGPPPTNHRLIIIATNVAETSLTIPGIRYVVDAGRSKQRLLESYHAGLARYEVRWISKASAEQRAGRAGRTGPGHCYRLYSSALFSDTFPQHTAPEIVNTSLEGVALNLKALGVDKVENFPFPTSPDMSALKAAEKCLVALSALDPESGRLTETGKAMARYPINPRHARMLLEIVQGAPRAESTNGDNGDGTVNASKIGKKRKKDSNAVDGIYSVLGYAVALAAASSVDSPFIAIDSIDSKHGNDIDNEKKKDINVDEKDNDWRDTPESSSINRKKKNSNGQENKEGEKERRRKEILNAARTAQSSLKIADSDLLSALCALTAFEASGEDEAFCREHYLHYKNLREASALRKQLARIVISHMSPPPPAQPEHIDGGYRQSESNLKASILTPPAYPPSPAVLLHLKKALAAGWADHVARRVRSMDHIRASSHDDTSPHKKSRAIRYRTCDGMDDDVFLHPNSMLYGNAPEYVVYSELIQTVKRPYMAGTTVIDARWLPSVAIPLCRFSEPLTDPAPWYDRFTDRILAWVDVRFGRHDWMLPRHAILHPDAKERYAVFAAALLDGSILPRLKELKHAFAAPPSMAARSDMRMHQRVYCLIDALERQQVDTRATLAGAWNEDPFFLSTELMKWMKKGQEGALKDIWGSLVHECMNTF